MKSSNLGLSRAVSLLFFMFVFLNPKLRAAEPVPNLVLRWGRRRGLRGELATLAAGVLDAAAVQFRSRPRLGCGHSAACDFRRDPSRGPTTTTEDATNGGGPRWAILGGCSVDILFFSSLSFLSSLSATCLTFLTLGQPIDLWTALTVLRFSRQA